MRAIAITTAALLSLSAPAFAQNTTAPAKTMGMSSHMHMSHHAMMTQGSRNKGLGSMRNPTVGNTANQRTNGG